MSRNPITNYGILLAEIQYYEGLGTAHGDHMADLLSKKLDAAREKDRKNQMTTESSDVNMKESGPSKD